MPIHEAGTTTPGAPDAIIDWFARFELFVLQAGWTIARRVSATEIFIRSLGESGDYTMLYIHVWRVGAGNTVRMEVCDDTVPTHETNEAGTVDSGGVNPFQYWMTANADCVIVAWNLAGSCRFIYAGALMPFALKPPDETYHMVATSQLNRASVLRFHDGTWDVDINNYFEARCDDHVQDPDTGTLPMMGLMADRFDEIAGQYHLISGEIAAATGLAQGDTIQTQDEDGATTTQWIVLVDNAGDRFAIWTGGDVPYGIADGSFDFSSGVANSPADFLAQFGAFAQSLGWTDNGDPGAPLVAAGDHNRQIQSRGEDGAHDIFVTWSYRALTEDFYLYVHDDLAYTHTAVELLPTNVLWYPLPYFFCGDLDCIVAAVRNNGHGGYECGWSGKVIPSAPGVSSPWMNIATGVLTDILVAVQILQNHTGAWNAAGVWNHADATIRANTSPNLYDGLSYVLWSDFFRIGNTQMIGLCKYVMYVGGNVLQGDLLPLEDQRFRAFRYDAAPEHWAMRIE